MKTKPKLYIKIWWASNGHFGKKYAPFVQRALSSHIIPSSEREKKYRNLADTYGISIYKESADISTIETLVLIYIANFREYRDFFLQEMCEESFQLAECVYTLCCDDINVAKFILEDITISRRYQKRKGFRKTKEPDRFSDSEKLFAYVITVLFIYRILQFEGEL